MKIRNIIFVLVLVIVAGACMKDNFDFDKLSTDMQWNPKFAIPLGNGYVNLEKFIEDQDSSGFIRTDDDKLLYVLFEQNMFSYTLEDMYPEELVGILPSIDINENYGIGLPVETLWPIPTGTQVMADSLIIKTGFMRVSLSNNNMLYPGSFEIGWGDLKIDGTPFLGGLTFTAGQTKDTLIPIDGYTLDMSAMQIDPDNVNVNLSGILTLDFGMNFPDENNTALIQVEIVDHNFCAVYGVVDQDILNLPADSVDFDFFGDVFNGDIYFADPQMEFKIVNTFGIPASLSFDDFRTINEEDNITMNFVGTGDYAGGVVVDVECPTVEGDSATTIFTLDGTNSNLAEMTGIGPNLLYYNLSASSSPGDDGLNFVTDSSSIDISLEARIPVYGYANGFELKDTIDLDLQESLGENFDMFDRILLRIWLNNGFPIDVDVQMYFADENYNIIEPLFTSDQSLLMGAPVDASGDVTGVGSTTNDIIITGDLLQRSEDTKYLIFVGNLQTTDADQGKSVKIKSNYEIGFKLGAQINLNYQTD